MPPELEGQGVIDDLGEGERLFRGTITGTILITHLPMDSAAAQIHTGEMDYQAVLHLSEHHEGPNTGRCLIRAHQDQDIAYVEIRCIRNRGECADEMRWVWGRGKSKGISGTTPFVAAIYYVEQEARVRVYGNAQWPEMTYALP